MRVPAPSYRLLFLVTAVTAGAAVATTVTFARRADAAPGRATSGTR